MKRTLLTLTLVAAAGAAGAQTMNSNAQTTTTPVNGGAQMSTGATTNGSASANMATAPTRLTGAAGTAQNRIEMDGYKNVQGLAKGSDGLWHGTAMRGSSQVQVTVDRSGKVSAQ